MQKNELCQCHAELSSLKNKLEGATDHIWEGIQHTKTTLALQLSSSLTSLSTYWAFCPLPEPTASGPELCTCSFCSPIIQSRTSSPEKTFIDQPMRTRYPHVPVSPPVHETVTVPVDVLIAFKWEITWCKWYIFYHHKNAQGRIFILQLKTTVFNSGIFWVFPWCCCYIGLNVTHTITFI